MSLWRQLLCPAVLTKAHSVIENGTFGPETTSRTGYRHAGGDGLGFGEAVGGWAASSRTCPPMWGGSAWGCVRGQTRQGSVVYVGGGHEGSL